MNQEVVEVVKQFPKVGQLVMVRHTVKRHTDGQVIGITKAGRQNLTPITAVYLDGTIRTGKSDVWDIKMGEQGWQTVHPNEVE